MESASAFEQVIQVIQIHVLTFGDTPLDALNSVAEADVLLILVIPTRKIDLIL